ncbi:GH25 family lysozyme [Dellaglioa sp. BT-FLS60]
MMKYVLFFAGIMMGIGVGAYRVSADDTKPEGVMGSNVPNSLVRAEATLSKSATNKANSIPDLSEFQGSFTDAQAKVLKKKFKFVILRVQYGSNRKDLVIDHNIAMMKKYNIPYGVYSFSQYENVADARVEAKDLYTRAKDAKFFVNDYEDQTVTNASKANTNAATKAWADEMAKHVGSRKVILYSYADFMNKHANTAVKGYDCFWLAAYQSDEPTAIVHSLWQYTSNYTNHGLSGVGGIDASIMNGKNADWFLGTSATSAAGKAQAYNKLVTVKKSGYNIWGNFKWSTKKGNTTKFIGKNYTAKYNYNHSNGSVFYSLYDKNNKWIGYVNRNAVVTAKSNQFAASVKVNKKGYKIWSNFFWSKIRNTTNNYYGKNFNVRYSYELGNGSTFYSLYNNAGTWIGYVNKHAVGINNTKYNKTVSVKKSYTIWGNFDWTKNKGETIVNPKKMYNVKYAYAINGYTYYSLYSSKGIWQGYVNSHAF